MEQYVISVGQACTATSWPNKSTSWADLVKRLGKCKRTSESVTEYKSMNKAQKGRAKDVGGFVGGTVRDGGHRKAESITARSLVTLDIDYGEKGTVGLVQDLLYGTAWCLYSTHSHTPEKPRYRVIIPLSREVSAEEYIPIARRVADDIGIDLFDSSTYEPSRLMYWPSCPRDGEFVYEVGEGDPLDVDKVLATYTDWRNVVEWPMDSRTVKLTQNKTGSRQEDPTEKPGVIGAFCRTYSITEAIETFLPEVYVPTVHPDRWTYAEGSTSGGLVIYEDKWAYSHHGTDPCCEKLVNAFDLVRVHLYGSEDENADINTPVNRLPSFLEMERMARNDAKVSARITKERLKEIQGEFGNVLDEEGEDDEAWKSLLKMDEKRKNFLPSPFNFGLICRHDKGLKGTVANDLFRGRVVLLKDLPWRPKILDPYWNNTDDAGLSEYVSKNYGMQGKAALVDAANIAAYQNTVHPVREYLQALEWDGKERLDTLLIDYLGAADCPLTRAMTRKHFTAAVGRVMRPGVKYDYVLTLIGPEGCGKSTLVRTMASEDWFSDSLTSIEGKDAMEQLRGKWLIEMGELTNYKRSTSEAYKAFISKQDDSFRPAYGRKSETYPRQCVFFATTNENNFLKGDTGNRRFWVVECDVDLQEKNVFTDLEKERDQIWAEAVVRWNQHEKLFLPDDMEKEARARQTVHNELASDERKGMIEAFVRMPLPVTWDDLTAQQRQDYFRTRMTVDSDAPTRRRETVCAVEVLVECFGQRTDEKTRYRTKEINAIMRQMDCLEYAGRSRDAVYGLQHRYTIKEDNL